MTRMSAKKQALIFTAGSVINLLLFCLTKYTAFPLWFDYAGSFYITVLCGPVLGGISVLLHTVLLVILIDGAAALLPMAVVATVCAVIAIFPKGTEKNLFTSLSCGFVSTVAAFILNTVILLCLDSPIGRYAFYADTFNVLCDGFGKFFAAVILSSAITFTELLLDFTAVEICYVITPKREENLIFKK